MLMEETMNVRFGMIVSLFLDVPEKEIRLNDLKWVE